MANFANSLFLFSTATACALIHGNAHSKIEKLGPPVSLEERHGILVRYFKGANHVGLERIEGALSRASTSPSVSAFKSAYDASKEKSSFVAATIDHTVLAQVSWMHVTCCQ